MLSFSFQKVSKETSPDTSTYALVLQMVLLVDNHALVDQTLGVGLGFDIDGTEIWVHDIDLLVTAADTPPDVSSLRTVFVKIVFFLDPYPANTESE